MLDPVIFNALNNPGNAQITPGTQRIAQVLKFLDNPQHKYKVIHITGTNGKGSTAAFIESGLVHVGYKVGKFTSPYIKVINECICLNHRPIADLEIEKHFWLVQEILNTQHIILSPFELLTAIMFNYFTLCGIDYLVLEVGMGGLDDATNVVDSIISIITNISLEHTRFLGNSLSEIAVAKSGIIKNGLTIIADNTPELVAAVTAKTHNYVNVLEHYNFTIDLDYEKFQTQLRFNSSASEEEVYNMNLFGRFQAYNFLCAYHVLNYLHIAKSSIAYAATSTTNPGRFEVLQHDPLVVLDATHNLSGAKNLVTSLQKHFNLEDVVIITSILADKDVNNMLGEFSTIASNIICTSIAKNPRALPATKLAHVASKYFDNLRVINNPEQALAVAKNMHKKLILVTGSLYLLKFFL